MSYILDALKRADAERERGQVPGLHTQSIGHLPSTERGPGLPRWALLGGGGAALVVVAALAWRMGADANAPWPSPPPAPEPAPAPVAVAAPAPVAVIAAAPAVEPPPAAPEIDPVEPTPAPATGADMAPAPPPRPVREGKPAATRLAAAPATPARATVRAPEPAPAAPAAVPLLAELPGSLRQQLPALTVTGSVYSDDARSRFIMLNGEVAKEGSQPAPGLVVERIESKSAVLRFKGQRFRLAY
jgi:general secretion pathway protein B